MEDKEFLNYIGLSRVVDSIKNLINSLPLASKSQNGIMSNSDKEKLDSIENGANKFSCEIITQSEYDKVTNPKSNTIYLIKN